MQGIGAIFDGFTIDLRVDTNDLMCHIDIDVGDSLPKALKLQAKHKSERERERERAHRKISKSSS
jgi:hypothetical protein